MSAELEMMNEENGRLRREVATWKAEFAKKERMTELVIDAAEVVNKELAAERDALRAENLGYAKSLLDLEAEVARLTKQYEALRQAYGLMHEGSK
jgi:hypothetical protein